MKRSCEGEPQSSLGAPNVFFEPRSIPVDGPSELVETQQQEEAIELRLQALVLFVGQAVALPEGSHFFDGRRPVSQVVAGDIQHVERRDDVRFRRAPVEEIDLSGRLHKRVPERKIAMVQTEAECLVAQLLKETADQGGWSPTQDANPANG